MPPGLRHHQLMTDDEYQVRRMLLGENDANRLGKWASLWADLIHVDMVLLARAQVSDIAANAFHRRALWESAIVSYGRMAVSDRRRKLDHDDLLRAARGERGVEFHKTLMNWRHDHVAHRLSRDLETVAVYADYLDHAPEVLDSIGVSVSAAGGPSDDSPTLIEFTEHVKMLRDTLWEKYLAPPAELIATRGPNGGMKHPGSESESHRSVRRLHPLGKMESCRQQRTKGTRPNCVSGQCGWSQKSNTSTRRSGPRSNPWPTNSASEQRRRCSTGSGERKPKPANAPA